MFSNLLHLLSTVSLGPVLIAQGLYVRRTIELLPEPDGDRRGVAGSGPSLNLLIIGDSAGAGVGCELQSDALLGQLVTRLANEFTVHYQLEATTGHTSADCLNQLQELTPRKVDFVLSSLGVNDVTSGRSVSAFAQSQRDIVVLLRDKFSAQRIILTGVPPMGHFPALPQPLRWYLGNRAKLLDSALRQVCQQTGAEYLKIDFDTDISAIASDGFHPGPRAYNDWAESVASCIIQEGIDDRYLSAQLT